jgi:amino-acid N-acetyltransferase
LVISLQDSIKLFRNSAPYINSHQGKTFVLVFGGEAVADSNFANIVNDIALLNSLGVRLVLVHGARPQIDERIALRGMEKRFHDEVRITDKATLECVKDAAGSVRAQVEALLSMGLTNSPMHGSRIRVCSGNLIVAQPIGVEQGMDFEYTGKVRRVDADGIRDHLNDGSIVLLPPMGYSPTGEVFNLSHQDVAIRTAIELKADKLIQFTENGRLIHPSGKSLRTLDRKQLQELINHPQCNDETTMLKNIALSVDKGVERCHCISYQEDGAVLQELFTRDGVGTMITQDHYEKMRQATIEDIGGILSLIEPLEEKGMLVKRSRDALETEIEYFTLLDRDGMIIACAALYPYPRERTGELACVATHPDYRGKSRGERLVEALKEKAKNMGLDSLFVLTTVTSHWFREQGFEKVSLEDLPQQKQQLYNYKRNSRVYKAQL